MNQVTVTTQTPTSDLIQVDRALESLRDSGFDLATAVGEVVDNSHEASATFIRIRTVEGATFSQGNGKKKGKPSKTIEAIAFADNGIGIPYETLPKTLKLGFSTRYNQRDGLGRFGVGMKLAAISQAKRVDIFTKPLGSNQYYHAYLDLTMIAEGEQTKIEAHIVEGYPLEYSDLMQHPHKGNPFESGTLVVWSKIDRLTNGGKYGSGIDEHIQGLTKFLSRAYRKYIDQGLYIELNGTHVTLHDPLFLLENPRVKENFSDDIRAKTIQEDDIRATTIQEDDIDIDGHSVHVTVTIYPENFRSKRGIGGREELDKRFKSLHIPDNEGRISILRNGREIYYDLIPKMFPSKVEDPDRFIGIEVSFPAALDEYFQVRHVKRGAEPVSKLREQLRKFLERPISVARKQIKAFWDNVDRENQKASSTHEPAENAVQRAAQTLPKGKAGMNISSQEKEQIVNNLLSDLKIDPDKEPEKVEEVKQKLDTLPITFNDGNWHGKELFEIKHLNGKAILTINHRHPFIREIYDPLKELAGHEPTEVDAEEAIRLAMKAEKGLDVLFMAYAMAENMHADPDSVYDDLRSDWGKFAHAYTREVLRDD
jgi:hypothetical protein